MQPVSLEITRTNGRQSGSGGFFVSKRLDRGGSFSFDIFGAGGRNRSQRALLKKMDPGLVTSERPGSSGPTVTCRSCRASILLDSIDTHECHVAPAAAKRPPSPIKKRISDLQSSVTTIQAVKRASSFLDTFLDEDIKAAASAPPKAMKTPASSTKVESTHDVRPADVVQRRSFNPDDGMTWQTSVHEYQSLPGIHSPSPGPSPRSPAASAEHSSAPDFTQQQQLPPPPPKVPDPVSIPAPMPTAPAPAMPSSVSAGSSSPVSSPIAASDRSPLTCRVRGVRVNKDRVAVYSILTSLTNRRQPAASTTAIANMPPVEFVIERRYREFYAFASTVCAMFPSQTQLWSQFPPKTYCNRQQTHGFLLRRKNGLDAFARTAMELMGLGTGANVGGTTNLLLPGAGSISQWYLVRKFLDLPPTLEGGTPTKDRSLVAASQELKMHAHQTSGWQLYRQKDQHDAIFEKTVDGFPMIKRVHTCAFPARAIFDMIVKGHCGSIDPNEGLSEPKFWHPWVEHKETLSRANGHTWTEWAIWKGSWTRESMQTLSIKSWKIKENGTIEITIVPADESDWKDLKETTIPCVRVDCILGGWIITPTPNEESCTVTWLMQANFGQCDPHGEFTIPARFSSSMVKRAMLRDWAEEIMHLNVALEQHYDPEYYRRLGPLVTNNELHKLELETKSTSPSSTASSIFGSNRTPNSSPKKVVALAQCTLEHPRAYHIAQELESGLCLMIHKNTNANVLIFKTNHRTKSDIDPQTPLLAEWIMFDKRGNPRQELSLLERNTTYSYATRCIGTNVHRVILDMVKRDCVLRYDPSVGFALFTTLNGKPNTRLCRVYMTYSKASSLSFARLEHVTLIGPQEMETIKQAT